MKAKYLYEGAIWFFEKGQQPNGAIEVNDSEIEDKTEGEVKEETEGVGEAEDEAMKAELQTKAVKPKNKAMEKKKK